jgi:hypothetical protein
LASFAAENRLGGGGKHRQGEKNSLWVHRARKCQGINDSRELLPWNSDGRLFALQRIQCKEAISPHQAPCGYLVTNANSSLL